MRKVQKATDKAHGKSPMRAEIVEISRALHKVGAVTDDALAKTTLKMLGTLPKVEAMSAADIAAVRELARVGQSVMAAYLNVAVSTVSQWERGNRQPSGAALKLLHVVKQRGIEILR